MATATPPPPQITRNATNRVATAVMRDAHRLRLVRFDERSAPGRGVDVLERLGERPAVAGRVFGRVLALAVLEIRRLHHDAGAVRPRALAVGSGVVDAYDDGVRDLTRSRRPLVGAHVGDDDGAVAEPELRAMAL